MVIGTIFAEIALKSVGRMQASSGDNQPLLIIMREVGLFWRVSPRRFIAILSRKRLLLDILTANRHVNRAIAIFSVIIAANHASVR
ncbi:MULTISPECIES: hypothetical protein [unclassified Brenneria]|uniref:hypothetical protein n=1 Tax=unclassified Brenneria TaxID=2634434 RepID=UPI0029C1D9C0|nr:MULTISPECIES: hypothetical protein [unclassified Brenneria]MDX5630228.1 hypothetical protein [Brenneria sp. L3-3Z]MDX5697373.1 hypothetical protein [Brenneria sp. L4-2C]MEE3664678.1 hypothetical protein [Brenneria sp. g21c3]